MKKHSAETPCDPLCIDCGQIAVRERAAKHSAIIILQAELKAEKARAEEAEAIIAAVHERIDEAGGIPSRDERGDLTLLERIDMLAKDCDTFERQIMRHAAARKELENTPGFHVCGYGAVCPACVQKAGKP